MKKKKRKRKRKRGLKKGKKLAYEKKNRIELNEKKKDEKLRKYFL